MTWTPITKPTNTTYVDVNSAQGREKYDDANVLFDDSGTFYDGIDINQWTELAKPASTTYTNVAKPT